MVPDNDVPFQRSDATDMPAFAADPDHPDDTNDAPTQSIFTTSEHPEKPFLHMYGNDGAETVWILVGLAQAKAAAACAPDDVAVYCVDERNYFTSVPPDGIDQVEDKKVLVFPKGDAAVDHHIFDRSAAFSRQCLEEGAASVDFVWLGANLDDHLGDRDLDARRKRLTIATMRTGSKPANAKPKAPLKSVQKAGNASRETEKKSAAQLLVELALEHYDLGVDTNGKAFGVRKGGHIAIPLVGNKSALRKEIGGLFRRHTSRVASQNALTEAIGALEYEAEEQGEPVKLHLRAARTADTTIYIDLGDKTERVVRVSADGWEILDGDAKIPVLFRRTNVTGALPTPVPGGDLDQLWEFVNLTPASRPLIKGWLVGAQILVGLPCPILAFLGEQGTAKTSSARRTFSLIDPTAASVRRPPSDADRLLHAGAHSRSVIFDNLSSIPRWLSDGMCRYVTGESDVDRSLYTDADARLIQVQGVLGFTGIDVGTLAGDLAERCVWCDLQIIPASERRSERELNEAWDKAYPSMVGGLLDLVVQTLQKLPEVSLVEKPRMADFAEVLAALDLATGSSSLDDYMRAQQLVAEDIVDTNEFLQAIVQNVTERWVGTGKELHELLPRPTDDKFWPKPRGISGHMRRFASDLRKSGWIADEIRPDPASKRPKTWVLVPPGAERVTETDIAIVQAARSLHDLDHDKWVSRLTADGMSPEVAAERAAVLRESPNFNVAAHRPMAVVSRAIDDRLFDELSRLGLTLAEFDQLAADRAGSPTTTEGNAA